jgi:DNA-binding MarR family transcriptional regulator
MNHIALDEYVVDVLMPDLAGHDRSPSSFLVYVAIWVKLFRTTQRSAPMSLQEIASNTGLSKSAVQAAIRILSRRSLIRVKKASATAVPEYELVRHWLRRRVR